MKQTNSIERPCPAYLQLYLKIREDITGGIYREGMKLPSKRALAAQSGFSVLTVAHAYELLCDEGYAKAKEKSGFYVIYRDSDCFPVAAAGECALCAPPILTSEAFPLSVLQKTVRSVLSKYAQRLLIKSPNEGCLELRSAIARYLARSRGIRVTPQQIVIGAGAEYLYSLLVQLLGRESVYGVENPSYEKIHGVYRANGVTCDLLTLGQDGILSEELNRTPARVLHITPFHSFPSGVTASASKRREYLRWAFQRGAIIIEDDFDSEFTVSPKRADTVFALQPEGGVLYLNTFSKTIAPSVRVGYLVLPPTMREVFQSKVGFYSCTVPNLTQYVLAEILESGDFERHINRVRRQRRKEANESAQANECEQQ